VVPYLGLSLFPCQVAGVVVLVWVRLLRLAEPQCTGVRAAWDA
jgi:hypothetical protein